jgi:hypothetical protein
MTSSGRVERRINHEGALLKGAWRTMVNTEVAPAPYEPVPRRNTAAPSALAGAVGRGIAKTASTIA